MVMQLSKGNEAKAKLVEIKQSMWLELNKGVFL